MPLLQVRKVEKANNAHGIKIKQHIMSMSMPNTIYYINIEITTIM